MEIKFYNSDSEKKVKEFLKELSKIEPIIHITTSEGKDIYLTKLNDNNIKA